MSIDDFLHTLRSAPASLQFDQTLSVIDANYQFTPTRFRNGDAVNEADQNQGSCKLLSFAQLQGLSADEALACFGQYYRDDVLGNPDGSDHQNIRNCIRYGWEGVVFEGRALTARASRAQ